MTRRIAMWIAVAASVAACAHILGLRQSNRRPFEHRAHVLEGVACTVCHIGITTAGEEGSSHIPDADSCVAQCHTQPHEQRNCFDCHGLPGAREAAQQAIHHLKFQHKNHVPRVHGNCVRCHVNVKSEDMTLRPSMAICLSCHAHADQFDSRDCESCHVDLPAERLRPQSHVVHDGEFLREHGVRAASAADLCATCHNETFCASCHGQTVPVLASRFAFDDPLRAGVHRAGFRSRHSEEARAQPGLCNTCHRVDFCTSCHSDSGLTAQQGNGSPHGPGWLGLPGSSNDHGPAAWRNAAECASCHSGAGEMLCVGCHQVGGIGGKPHAPGWSSTRSKSDLPCRLCHTRALR